jgi:segregation and condensation protein A
MSAYRVELDLFHGPLDLLLHLVRRNELDVRDVRLSQVAVQFAAFLEVLEFIDLDLVGEFLVMATTLMEIKSREALPQEAEEPEAEAPIDSRSGLIQQLLEYRKYKDAAKSLEERAAEWQQRFPRLSSEHPRSGKNPAADFIKEVELWDLVSALSRVLRRNTVERETRILYDDTPISTWIERIGQRVREEGRTAFSTLFERETIRSRIVGMFLAVLELIRHHSFRAEQPADFGEIWILPPAAENREPEELRLAA